VITTRSIFLFLFATGGVVALLAFGWKFGVEEWLDPFLPGEHAADSIAERWEFVIASTFFAIAATAPPSLFVGRLLRERMTADRLSAAVFDSAPQPMLVTDHERTILAINPAFEEMSGWSRADLVGCPASTLRSGDHPDEFYKSISHALDTTGAWTGEVTNRRQDGSPYAAALAITGVRDERGNVIEFIGVLTDITWRKQREEQALFDATHDPLTGLANRRLLMVRLRQVIAASTVSAEQFAVLFLDLDGFKQVNDTHGHAAGDELLRIVAARLRRVVRAQDVVCRIGGDEFACMIGGMDDPVQLTRLADKMIDAVSKPCTVGPLHLMVEASMGIATCPADGRNSELLLDCADQAMYAAKQRQVRYAFFSRDGGVATKTRQGPEAPGRLLLQS
jgi:diguanylate cyclase (GGDEF)-like protein/PAS domain S-box-containing protein